MTASNKPTGRGVSLEERAVEALASTLRGDLISPEDPTYDQHRRVWNGSIDRHPGLIAAAPAWRTSSRQCASPDLTAAWSQYEAEATVIRGCRYATRG
jgi:hypothetical protein